MTIFDLAERVVVVTGGASGLGLRYSQALAAAGARPVLADLDGDLARREAESIGPDALGLAVDVGDEESVDAMAQCVIDRFGRIDGLVNNAALMSTLPRRRWDEIPLNEWDRVMTVNVRGSFLCCRAVVPAMRTAGGGKIVNVSSQRVFEGTPLRLHYTTSKAAIVGFTRALARELGADGINVNAVAPGLTLSDAQLASSDDDYIEQFTEGRALGRAQTPDDLLGTVLFLLCPASDYLTGQTIVVDGGRTMR